MKLNLELVLGQEYKRTCPMCPMPLAAAVGSDVIPATGVELSTDS